MEMNKILLTIIFMTISFPCFSQGHTTKNYDYKSFVHPYENSDNTYPANSSEYSQNQTVQQENPLNQFSEPGQPEKSTFKEWVDFFHKVVVIIIIFIVVAFLVNWSYNCPGY